MPVCLSVNLKSEYRKTKGGRNLIFLQINKQDTEKNLRQKKKPKRGQVFLLCLFVSNWVLYQNQYIYIRVITHLWYFVLFSLSPRPSVYHRSASIKSDWSHASVMNSVWSGSLFYVPAWRRFLPARCACCPYKTCTKLRLIKNLTLPAFKLTKSSVYTYQKKKKNFL